ncbi:MAG: DPP IV N-terminal domain-containing protein, partial [Myxococcales bacterium]|nr:DPP IV N-terminal domain-containing protein [Myxococcales bacterium]
MSASTLRGARLALLFMLPAFGCGAAQAPVLAPPSCPEPEPEPEPRPEPTSVADPAFADDWAATSGFRAGQPASITITPSGDAVLFLRSGPRDGLRQLYSFEVDTGEERLLLTAEQVLQGAEEELSDEERARRERLRLAARGITRFELSPDGSKILVPISGRLFVVDRGTGAVRELPGEGGYADDPHFSPNGEFVACVRAGDLYAIRLADGRQRRLTRTANAHRRNGMPEFVAQEEMQRYRGFWWAPDSSAILYQQTDTEGVEILHASDPIHPERPARAAPYPRAGRSNAVVRLALVPLVRGPQRWFEWDRELYPYLATVRWKAQGLLVLVQNRSQTREALLRFDPSTGEHRELLVEEDAAWLNLDQSVPAFVGDDGAFLWSSERSGEWELELRRADGSLDRVIA